MSLSDLSVRKSEDEESIEMMKILELKNLKIILKIPSVLLRT